MLKHIGIALALATALASAHCAGGGPSGTHLSVVKGNVVDADEGGVDGIRVSVEGTPFETVTDASGSFLIEGDFEGASTLLFEREADGFAARIAIDVPQGGTVTLRDVSCPESGGLCEAEDIDVDEPSDGVETEPDDIENDGNGVGNGADLPTPENAPIATPQNSPVPTPQNSPVPTPANAPVPTAPNPPVPTARNPPVPTARNPPVPTPRNPPIPTPRNSGNQTGNADASLR